MKSHFPLQALSRFVLAVCLSIAMASSLSAAKRTKGAITKPKFDPKAKVVDLFEGIESGTLKVTVIPKNSKKGNVLFENMTDKPLTVNLPKGFVGQQILKQFGGGGFGGGGLGGGGFGGGGMGGRGGGQSFGGGMGGMGGMGGGLGGGMGGGQGGGGFGGGNFGAGGGFFSIPPEKVVRLPYQSVCLEHGKAEPRPRMRYRLVKIEQYTKNPALRELIELIGTNRIDQQVAQAAAWHMSSNMSWRELASKLGRRLGGNPQRYFTRAQLMSAQKLVALSVGRSKEKKEPPAEQPVRSRTQAARRTR